MKFKQTKKFVKKAGKRIYRGLKQRYSGWNGIRNGVNDVASVAKLAAMINAEKRRITQTIQASSLNCFGQFNQTSSTTATSGHYVYDFTPIVAQGNGITERSGSSIKLTSSYMKFQFVQMDNASGMINFKGYFIQVLGTPQNVGTMANQFLQPNLFITGVNTLDYNSLIKPDFLGQYKILKTIKGTVNADNIAGQTMITEKIVKFKWNKGKGHHIRYDGNTNTIADGQIIFIMTADVGNNSVTFSNTGTPSINGVFARGAGTGIYLNMSAIHYYYDN